MKLLAHSETICLSVPNGKRKVHIPQKWTKLYRMRPGQIPIYLTGIILLIGLSACGVVYHSPKISEVTDGGINVQVLPLTGESLRIANQNSYTPRELPPAFHQTSGRGALNISTPPPPRFSNPVTNVSAQHHMRLPPPQPISPYEIGVGDTISLTTRSIPATSGLQDSQNSDEHSQQEYTVQDDGAISIPDIGRIEIAGMTLENAEAAIFQNFLEQQADPVFGLEISAFNSARITISGAVAQPGISTLGLTPVYLREALSEAGGLQLSDPDSATIRLHRAGKMYRIPVSEYMAQPDVQNLRMVAGDAIYADAGHDQDQARIFFEEQIQIANLRQNARRDALNALSEELAITRANLEEQRSNFEARQTLGNSERDYVYLTGEVAQQGRYPLPFGRKGTLADAIFEGASGLPTETANLRQIYVLRGSSGDAEFDTITAWHLDAGNAVNLLLATRFTLVPNDIIFVAEQPITRWGRVVRQISPSLITTPITEVSN